MKRSELVDAKEKLTPQEDESTEEPDDDTVGGEDEKDEADVEPEGDFEDLGAALASLEEDEKGIMAAIDDVMDDDYKEPTDEDDDEWTEDDDYEYYGYSTSESWFSEGLYTNTDWQPTTKSKTGQRVETRCWLPTGTRASFQEIESL